MTDPTRALIPADELARAYVARAKAPNTLRAYQADWRHFTAWCAGHDRPALPATGQTLAFYLAELAAGGVKVSTLQRRLSAIAQAHQAAGQLSPTKEVAVRAVWAGIRRTHGTAPAQKAPLVPATLRQVLAQLPENLRGCRDRALLLLGFAGAFRRGELAGLDVGDVVPVTEGLIVTLRRSKTDPEGAGRRLGIPYGSGAPMCPVRAVAAWQQAAHVTAGPLFRPIDRHGNIGPGRLSDRTVARIVQGAVAAAGLDPTRFGGHSLRAGFATAAAAAGVAERDIARQTGHQSVTVLRGYIRQGQLFRNNAVAALL